VPAWAFRQIEAFQYLKKFVNWYIDKRQIENGELGGGLSDDGDLTNWWPGTALMGANPAKIERSLLLELDAFYVEHWSIWLDLRILALTALKVLHMEDVRPEASEFWGSHGPPAEGPRAFPVEADETMDGPCMEVERDGRR
jgi:hypothetical protein